MQQAPTASPPTTQSRLGTVNLTLTLGEGSTGSRPASSARSLSWTPYPAAHRFTNSILVNQVPILRLAEMSFRSPSTGCSTRLCQRYFALSQIIVFGSKTNDLITVDPSVTVPATLNGGTGGGKNTLKGGGGPTLENGWFGHNLLVGGSGPERTGRPQGPRPVPAQLTTTLAYVGNASPAKSKHHPVPPGGIYYRFVNGHLVRVK